METDYKLETVTFLLTLISMGARVLEKLSQLSNSFLDTFSRSLLYDKY